MTIVDSIPYLMGPDDQKHWLQKKLVEIGRADDNDIVIDSKLVSRKHALIRKEGSQRFLEDRGSANGTFLNRERVSSSLELHDGDRISIGEIILVYHDSDTDLQNTFFPEIEVDSAAGVVRLNQREIHLSPKEFILLVYLEQHSNQICSRDEIRRTVWPEYYEAVYDYQIENLIRRLRAKIEYDPNNPQLLLTIRGSGYKLIS